MTSTLLTASNARAGAGCGMADIVKSGRGEMRLLTPQRQPSAYFRAIARHDVFLFGVFLGRLFNHRPQQFIVALDPVGHIDPLRAVPLVDARHARAFMIVARELQRLHEATEPEL